MKKLFLILFALSCCYYSNAQDLSYASTNETELWAAGRFQYKLGKKWIFSVEEQTRFDNNFTDFDRWFLELETKYQLFKKWEIGLGYRYIGLNDNEGNQQGYETYRRWNFDVNRVRKIKRFELETRFRFQSKRQLNIENPTTLEIPATTDLRLKWALSYNIRQWKLDPKIGYEAFWHSEYGDIDGFTKYRFFIGTDYRWNKHHKIACYFVQENETKIWAAKNHSIIRLRYTYQLRSN